MPIPSGETLAAINAPLPARAWMPGSRPSASGTTRYFPDKLPIALDADGEKHVFVFLVTERQPVAFRAFLERHAELWRSLPAWTVRVLVPWKRRTAVPLYQEAFHQQLASPLSLSVLEDLRWYFRARATHPGHPDERFDEAE